MFNKMSNINTAIIARVGDRRNMGIFSRDESQQRGIYYQGASRKHDKNIESESQQDLLISEKASEEIVPGCRRKIKNEGETDEDKKVNIFVWHRNQSRMLRAKVYKKDYEDQLCLKLHNQEDLEASVKILETENKSLLEQSTALRESTEMMQGEINNFCQQKIIFKETVKKIEKESLQRKNKSLHKCLSYLSKTINLYMEQNRKQEESNLSLEDTIKMRLEANHDTRRVNETSQQEKASEGIIRNLERENERLQDYTSALEKNIKEITEALEEYNHNIIQSEEIIEGLKISESAHEDTVRALLRASENQQEKEASLTLRIKELEKELERHEELMRNTENTVKMLMEKNDRYRNTEASLQEVARKCEEDSERYRDSHLCLICLTEERQMVFRPCGHLLTCRNCSKLVLHCPLCRQKVFKSLKYTSNKFT